ncbi:MAG: kelch repeat-containing protein [Candidatus Acidiferrales bacterium]
MKRCLSAAVVMCALCVLSACGGGASGANGGGGPQLANHFSVMAPTTAFPNTFFSVTVVALDSSNNTVFDYPGIVHFTSSDPQAVLPGDSMLTAGTGTFTVALGTVGNQMVTATDITLPNIKGSSNSIDVASNLNLHGFQATGEMGTARAGHAAALLANGKVLVTGGSNNTGNLATAELYDPASGTFTATGTMTAARTFHTATLLDHGPAATNGKVLITGGSIGFLSDLATAELYDPATGTFTATGTMSEVRSEHTATLLANGKVLVAGGTADNVAELYDPATGTFAPTTGELVVGGRWGCTATLLNDGTVLIAGGRDAEDVYDADSLNDAELFNPATGTFTATGGMTDVRYDHTAALLGNGEVLMTGGFNGQPLQSAELFDPTTGAFSVTGSMSTPRAKHTAAVLADGTVMVAGGFSYIAPGSFSSAEVFDPVANTFIPTGPMGAPRFSHTATRLNNGLVLMTGGQSNITIPAVFASSADLYK